MIAILFACVIERSPKRLSCLYANAQLAFLLYIIGCKESDNALLVCNHRAFEFCIDFRMLRVRGKVVTLRQFASLVLLQTTKHKGCYWWNEPKHVVLCFYLVGDVQTGMFFSSLREGNRRYLASTAFWLTRVLTCSEVSSGISLDFIGYT